jgi:hypothetical protein
MRKVIEDPGEIIDGPGREGPPEFVKVEIGEGWPSKWVGPDQAGESLPAETLRVLEVLEGEGLEGLLLPAVQKVSEHVSFNFVKITQEDTDAFDSLLKAGAFDEFEDMLVLNPEAEQAGGFIKIGDIKGESQDTPDMGAWTPVSDFSDADLF